MKKWTVSVAGLVGALFLLAAGVGSSREAAHPDVGEPSVTLVGEMSAARAAHQATVLTTGHVLVTGGCRANGCDDILSSAELYDPVGRTFRPAATMRTPRVSHAAVVLPDGRVLVAGGWTGEQSTASAEVYEAVSGRLTPVGEMAAARMGAAAIPLADGRVLIAGGEASTAAPLASAEIFDPATGAFLPSAPMRTPRAAHAAVALADGRVLVTGGNQGRGQVLRSAEIFDPASREFQFAGDMSVPRHKHAAVLLADGRVMIIGGSDASDHRGRHTSTEMFDPSTGKFSPGPELRSARYKLRDAVLVLPSGAVLVAGGSRVPEHWVVGQRSFSAMAGELAGPQAFATASLLPSGQVLVLGGYDDRIRTSASAWLIRWP